MSIQVLQRFVWDGRPINQAEFIRLQKLQLLIDGDFQRSQVCRTQDDVLDTVDEWREEFKKESVASS